MAQIFTKEAKEQRKTFLTVISTMSMICCMYIILQSLASFFIGPMSQEEIDKVKLNSIEAFQANDEVGEEEAEMLQSIQQATISYVQQSNDNFYGITIMSLIVGIIGLLGALMMINLDKRGYGLYLTSCLLWTFGSHLFIDSSILLTIVVLMYGVISLAFIIMYSVNLKHMNLKYF